MICIGINALRMEDLGNIGVLNRWKHTCDIKNIKGMSYRLKRAECWAGEAEGAQRRFCSEQHQSHAVHETITIKSG